MTTCRTIPWNYLPGSCGIGVVTVFGAVVVTLMATVVGVPGAGSCGIGVVTVFGAVVVTLMATVVVTLPGSCGIGVVTVLGAVVGGKAAFFCRSVVTVPSFGSDDEPLQAARPKIDVTATAARALCLNILGLLMSTGLSYACCADSACRGVRCSLMPVCEGFHVRIDMESSELGLTATTI